MGDKTQKRLARGVDDLGEGGKGREGGRREGEGAGG